MDKVHNFIFFPLFQNVVASYYNITVEDLKGKRRSANIAYPRQIAMYLSRILTEETFPKIGLDLLLFDNSDS